MKSRPATYEYACQNVYADCSTTIDGESEEEVQRKALQHIREHHGALESNEETVRSLLPWIRPVA